MCHINGKCLSANPSKPAYPSARKTGKKSPSFKNAVEEISREKQKDPWQKGIVVTGVERAVRKSEIRRQIILVQRLREGDRPKAEEAKVSLVYRKGENKKK